MRLISFKAHVYGLLFLFVSQTVIAGVVFEVETRDFGYSPPVTENSTVYAEGIALKMESRNGQQGESDEMIFRGDRREMMVVDHGRRTYMIIDQQFAAKMAGQVQQMAGQMQGMLNNVPPEQRAMMEQMMNNQQAPGQMPAKPKVEVHNTGQRAKVYGYPCVLLTITQQGRKVRDVWVTNWNNIQGSRELAATFDSMSEFTQKLLASFPMQGESPMQDNAFMTIKQMGGFPVATREYRADGTVASETALRSASVQSINPAIFQPPAGYQADSMFGGPSLGGVPTSGPSANMSQYGQGRR